MPVHAWTLHMHACQEVRVCMHRKGSVSALKASPSLSSERMRSVLAAIATIPSGQCSDANGQPCSRCWYEIGDSCRGRGKGVCVWGGGGGGMSAIGRSGRF